MNIAELIRAYELKHKTNVERQTAIMEQSATEGRTLTEEEDGEYESLKTELKAVDAHIERLKEMETRDAATAKPPAQQKSVPGAAGNKAPMIISRRYADADPKFKGQMFVRKAIAAALARLEDYARPAWVIADERWGKECPLLVQVMKAGIQTKAGVPGHGSGTGEAGAELVQADARYAGDFVEFLYSMTVFDQLALREVPANVTIKGQDGAATGFWVGESKSIPATGADFSTVSLTPLKVGAIAVGSNEWLRDSSPSAELLLRDTLAQASAQRIDTTFLSANAAVAGVSPAGILNGVTALGSNGQDGTAVREDLKELYTPFITAKIPTNGMAIVMHPNTATSLALMANALGQDEFPDLGPDGGTLRRIQVVTGHNVAATHIIMIKPNEIWKIADSGVEISLSREATIEQDTAPTGASDTPTAASATLMSMFGTESTAFKVVRSINYAKRRTAAVSFISDALYGTFT